MHAAATATASASSSGRTWTSWNERRELRPLREEPLSGFRRRLCDDRELARLDRGEEGVQHPEAVLRVLARVERSFEIGQVPDHRLAAHGCRRTPSPAPRAPRRRPPLPAAGSRPPRRRSAPRDGRVAARRSEVLPTPCWPTRSTDLARRLGQPLGDRGRRSPRADPTAGRGGCRTAASRSCRCRRGSRVSTLPRTPRGERSAKAGAENVLLDVDELFEIVAQMSAARSPPSTLSSKGSPARWRSATNHAISVVAHALLDGRQRSPDQRRRSVLQERAKDVRVLRRRRALELRATPTSRTSPARDDDGRPPRARCSVTSSSDRGRARAGRCRAGRSRPEWWRRSRRCRCRRGRRRRR